MSKGSSYWSTARGKIGNTVVSVVRGQRIERAYQPSVANPKTPKQMTQRAKFFSAVGFYKQATQSLFKMAFEDKRQTESDYNAFMRHNVASAPMFAPKTLGTSAPNYVPFMSNWMLSQGSLASLRPVAESMAQYSLTLNNFNYKTAIQTIGQFSDALVGGGNGYQYGDIVTFVKYKSSAYNISADDGVNRDPVVLLLDLENMPRMEFVQFVLSASDDRSVEQVWMNENAGGAEAGESASVSLTFDDFDPATGTEGDEYIGGFAVIVSRPGTTLKVSDSYLVPTKYTEQYMEVYESEEWKQGVLQQWSAAEPVVLEGALV